jgi:hypothetical protein
MSEKKKQKLVPLNDKEPFYPSNNSVEEPEINQNLKRRSFIFHFKCFTGESIDKEDYLPSVGEMSEGFWKSQWRSRACFV